MTSPKEQLLPCPFCGHASHDVRENGRMWTGQRMSEPVSVSVIHWCPAEPGQPSRIIERVGRDHASAIAAWNRRASPNWWHCDLHGPGTRTAWGCPECVREMREEIAQLRAREKACATMDEAEKVALIRAMQECCGTLGLPASASPSDLVREVVTLRKQADAQVAPEVAQPDAWVPVSERLPDSGVTVLACYISRAGQLRRIRAEWIAAKTQESGAESDIGEYDEATDTYYEPEGWYERIDNWDDYSAVAVTQGEVTHWMRLPAAPAPPQAVPEVAQPVAWQPIETAPRDGTEIRLGFMEDGEIAQTADMQWSHIQRNGMVPGVVGMWVCPGANFTWSEEPAEFGPTHWQPIPAAPVAMAKEPKT